MIPNAPAPDPLVEALFLDVLLPPDGYEYFCAPDSPQQLLYPVFGQDRWRLLLRNKATNELTPVFIEGAFVLKLTKALNAMQRELNQAVTDDIPAPVRRVQ